MGSGQSVAEVEASKPADASDVPTGEAAALEEVKRLRALLRSQVEAKSARETADDPDKAYNQNVVSVFRSHVLQRIGPDGRNDDDDDGGGGKMIKRDKLIEALVALYKSSSAPLDDDPARLAAALCFASTEAAPDAMSDAKAAAYLERALEQRLVDQQQHQEHGKDGGRVRAPPAPPILSPEAAAAEVAAAEALYQSTAPLEGFVKFRKVVLVNADYLLALSAKGEAVPACQELPEEAKYEGPMGEDEVVVLAISYCWASKAHPDPDGKILKEICEFIKYLEASRHYKAQGVEGGIKNKKIVVFLDYMSLPQKSAKAGTTLLDAHAFSVGLKECVNVLYASACTWTILCSDSHKYSKEKRAAYRESGWTTFEELLSNMVKHSDKVIDLPKALEWMRRMDPNDTESNKSLYFLREYVRRETRTLPRHPDVFVKDLVHLIFTNKADKAFVERKYRTTYGAVVAPHKVFALENVARARPPDWRNFLWEVVAKGKCLGRDARALCRGRRGDAGVAEADQLPGLRGLAGAAAVVPEAE